MRLSDYYFHDPRLVLLPIEHLSPLGMSSSLAALLGERAGWPAERVHFFNGALSRYWTRVSDLATRTRTWAPPRIRHVAVVHDPQTVLPYVQLLNTSSWTLYACDFDPAISDVELAAYLLVHGDRMAITGEVSTVALANAAYWFDRTEAECDAFAAAAARSPRPDAAAFRLLADAISWMRALFHDTLRPPRIHARYRNIPGTGLLVPPALELRPTALVDRWTAVAQATVASFHAAWRRPEVAAVAALCEWLAADAPPLLLTGQGGRIIWDPRAPQRLGILRQELRQAGGAAVRDIAADLAVVADKTRHFHRALVDPEALPSPHPDAQQTGYTYLHRDRGLVAYNLHEPGLDRLRLPALPYARAMLGARTVHEWAHLAVDAAWVPLVVSANTFVDLTGALAEQLDAVITGSPPQVRDLTAVDLAALTVSAESRPSPGAALANVLLSRLPDFQANLLAQRFLDEPERETYVRQNVRTLRAEYAPAELWRMLVRYLYEYQYLRFSAVEDRRAFFLRSTWFEADFMARGLLSDESLERLAASVAALCDSYAVDERRFRSS